MPNVLELTAVTAARTMDCDLLPYTQSDYSRFEYACAAAAAHGFGGVYVTPYMLGKLSAYSKELLKSSGVKLCSFVADSLGSLSGITGMTSEEIAEEVPGLAKDGADALDFMLFPPLISDRETAFLKNNIESFINACREASVEPRIVIAIDKIPEKDWDYAFSLLTHVCPDVIKVGSEQMPAYARPSMLDLISIQNLLEKHQLQNAKLQAMNIGFESTAYALLQIGADRIHVQDSVYNAVSILDALPILQRTLSVKRG